MKIPLVALGSAGDVHPFLPLAGELARRGHRPVVLANPVFQDRIEALDGVAFVPLGTEERYRELTEDPDLFHPTRGPRRIFGTIGDSLEEVVEAVRGQVEPGDTVLVGSSLALGARLVQEADRVPLVTVHLQPTVLRSLEAMPRLPFGTPPAWTPRWFLAGFFRFADRMLDGMFEPGLGRERERLGLPPVRRVLDRWWHSPERVVGLFPEWFAPPPSDWPQQLVLTGFVLHDAAGERPVDAALDTWLDGDGDGDNDRDARPLLWTAGSAQRHAGEFFAAAVEASRRLGRRALLVSTAPETLPSPLPDGILHRDYVPFGRVLPRCAALVHHGGVGTMAQGFAAAVPQLVVPFAHDQFDNGARVAALGLGDHLPGKRFSAGAAADRLEALLADDEVAERCRQAARRMAAAEPVTETCDWIERTGGSRGAAPLTAGPEPTPPTTPPAPPPS